MSHINEAMEEFFRKERIAEMEEMARNGEYVFDCETIKLVVKQDIDDGGDNRSCPTHIELSNIGAQGQGAVRMAYDPCEYPKAKVEFDTFGSWEHTDLVKALRFLLDVVEHGRPTVPTWADGSPVMVGQRAISMVGPMTIERIDSDQYGYSLVGTYDGNEYVIDEGRWNSETSHPTREGEWCDFWPETEAETVEYYGLDETAMNTGRTPEQVLAAVEAERIRTHA